MAGKIKKIRGSLTDARASDAELDLFLLDLYEDSQQAETTEATIGAQENRISSKSTADSNGKR